MNGPLPLRSIIPSALGQQRDECHVVSYGKIKCLHCLPPDDGDD